MRDIDTIVVHCSDSSFGDVALIDAWHRERGFDRIGYHHVILNGLRKNSRRYDFAVDGLIQQGRPHSAVGAHAKGHNSSSIGICLIGKGGRFSISQWRALFEKCCELMEQYDIPLENVVGHNELDSGKTCPDFDVGLLRGMLAHEALNHV